ncbi:hypothetical protein Pelo_18279 [Pelomyxa schiedti]|nr:hypothetical protein Pelo_18279 [Pelomyxa schiedti]
MQSTSTTGRAKRSAKPKAQEEGTQAAPKTAEEAQLRLQEMAAGKGSNDARKYDRKRRRNNKKHDQENNAPDQPPQKEVQKKGGRRKGAENKEGKLRWRQVHPTAEDARRRRLPWEHPELPVVVPSGLKWQTADPKDGPQIRPKWIENWERTKLPIDPRTSANKPLSRGSKVRARGGRAASSAASAEPVPVSPTYTEDAAQIGESEPSESEMDPSCAQNEILGISGTEELQVNTEAAGDPQNLLKAQGEVSADVMPKIREVPPDFRIEPFPPKPGRTRHNKPFLRDFPACFKPIRLLPRSDLEKHVGFKSKHADRWAAIHQVMATYGPDPVWKKAFITH